MYGYRRFSRADTVPPHLLGEASSMFPALKPILITEPQILNHFERLKPVEKLQSSAPQILSSIQHQSSKSSLKPEVPIAFTKSGSSTAKLQRNKAPTPTSLDDRFTSRSHMPQASTGSNKRKLSRQSTATDSPTTKTSLPYRSISQQGRHGRQTAIKDTSTTATSAAHLRTESLPHHSLIREYRSTHLLASHNLDSVHENRLELLQRESPVTDSEFDAYNFAGPMDHIHMSESSKWENPNKIILQTNKMTVPRTRSNNIQRVLSKRCNTSSYSAQSNSSLPRPSLMGQANEPSSILPSGMRTASLQQPGSKGRLRRLGSISSSVFSASSEEPEYFSGLVTDMDESEAISSPYMPLTPNSPPARSDSHLLERSGSVYNPAIGLVHGPDTPVSNSNIATWNPKRLRQKNSSSRLSGFRDIGPVLPSIEMDDIWEVPDDPRDFTPDLSADDDRQDTHFVARSESRARFADECDVLQIVGEKIGTGIHEFLVNWVGNPERIWIPSDDCFCPDLVGDFRESQRVKLAEARQAGRQAEIETLQHLADAKLVRDLREADLLKLPKTPGWRYSRRNARNGRFQGPGQGNSYVEWVKLATPPLARNDRANTAILPPGRVQRPWNAPADPNRNEVIWIRTDVVNNPKPNYRLASSVKREITEEKPTHPVDPMMWTDADYGPVDWEQERREMERRKADDAEEARKRHLAEVEEEKARKLHVERQRDEAEKAHRAKEASSLERQKEREKQLVLKTESEPQNNVQEMEDIVRKYAKKDRKKGKTPNLEIPKRMKKQNKLTPKPILELKITKSTPRPKALRPKKTESTPKPKVLQSKKAAATPKQVVLEPKEPIPAAKAQISEPKKAKSPANLVAKVPLTKKEAGHRRVEASKVQKSQSKRSESSIRREKALADALVTMRKERESGQKLVRPEFMRYQSEKEAQNLIRDATMFELEMFRKRLDQEMGYVLRN